MSKTELIEFIADKAEMSKAEAGRALDAVLVGITEGLKKEGEVTLIKIPAKTVATFKAGSKLKDAIK